MTPLRCRLGFHRIDPLCAEFMGFDWCIDCNEEGRPDLLRPRWWRWLMLAVWRFRYFHFDPWLQRQKSYWQPCPECGRLHHDCDETHDHIPF